jgi:hypothetical protein
MPVPTVRRCWHAAGGSASGCDLLAGPGRPAQHQCQLVAALDREQLDRTTGERITQISDRATGQKLQPEGASMVSV